jgi:SEC-C motif-containing protein
VQPTDPCPCGSGESFGQCCLPLHIGERQADTAEELMRSRYSAFVADDLEYIWRTWHPRTRPGEATAIDGLSWTGLEIVDASDDEVEFRAHYREGGQNGTLHERSRFAIRAHRWFYVDGDLLT